MRKHRTAWNLILVMASLALGLLILPPEVKAEMIASRTQSGKALSLVRQQLCSELVQQEIQRFGLSKSEAQQIQAVFADHRVSREMVQLEREVARTPNVSIEQKMTGRLLTALQSSVKNHMKADLRQELSERARKIPGNQRLIASRLSMMSVSDGTVDGRIALAQAQRALTAETLVALGMPKEDAAKTIAKLKDSDIDRIFTGGLRIGYPAGIDFSSGDGQLLLVIIILVVVAILVGGAVGVVLLIVILIALVYYLGGGHWSYAPAEGFRLTLMHTPGSLLT
ncbi:MAG: hypothetical protein P8Z79_00420 [Sedimentisphaerales bacterium]|jgi:predicted RND superfamily exporter protein